MEQFVGQATCQLHQHFFGAAAVGQQALGLDQFFIAQAFTLLTIRLKHVDRRQLTQAHHKVFGAGADHFLGSLGCALATLEVFGDHFVQIIDAIEVNVVQLADFRLDITGNSDIHHEDRFVLAQLQRALDRAFAQDRQLAGGGADDDIAAHQLGRDVREQHRVGAKLLGQDARALQGAVGDHDTLDAQVMQVASDQGDGFTGADQQRLAALQVTENLFGQAHGGERDGHRVFTDGGVGAHLLGRIERSLEQTAKQRADGASLAGHGVGGFHLAEDLRLAQHQRVEPCGDAHHVTNCRILFVHICTGAQVLEIQMVIIGQPAQHHIR